MASVAIGLVERRGECRRDGGGPRWHPRAMMRPGQAVTVINISSRAALLESPGRLRPGAATELQLAAGATRTIIKGRLDRCHVAALDPLRYRGVLIFDHRVEISEPPDTG